MIWIPIITAVVGILFVGILFTLIRAAEKEVKLKKHRSQGAGLADLLNYAALVDESVIVCKNGSFMAAWIYQGKDNSSATDEEREQVSSLMNQVLAKLGNGWMLHVDAVRRPAPTYSDRGLSHFADPVTEAIDEERRRLFERMGVMYEGYFVLTLTYFPPMLAQRKFVDLMFDDDEKTPDHKVRSRGLVDQFKRDCENISSLLSSAVTLQRLGEVEQVTEDGLKVTHHDLLRWLQFCITGLNHPVHLPKNGMYLDCLIGGQELVTGVIPKIGRNFMQVVAIEGFPSVSYPGILSSVGELPCEYRWSSRFIFMDQHEAEAHLEKFRKKWKQKIRGFVDQLMNNTNGTIDQDALAMVDDAEGALAEVRSGLIAQGYYTSCFILMDPTRSVVEQAARQIEKAVNKLGFAARVETINTMDAYLGSLPGHGVENVRRPLINTMNLADLLPTSTIWTGENVAPCPMYPPFSQPLMHCVTHGATPFRFNLHVRDVGHTVVFGPIGAGKSTFLGLIAAQLRRYQGMTVFAFDKGNSLYPLAAGIRAGTEGKSGLHFTVAGDDNKLQFCPLQFLDTKTDRAWAMEWIDTILKLNGVLTTPAQRNHIGEAIVSMSKGHGHTLTDFSLAVQDDGIREALRAYTADGSMGYLLDADQDGLSLSDFTVFEIEELMNLGEKYALPVLLYLFRRIEKSLVGQPAAIILDEAWLMLGHEAFAGKIREWLKVLRKANCLVIMATQQLSDAKDSGIFDVILEGTATKVFLPNVYAHDEATGDIYRRMGLNARQIQIVASAVPKRQYYSVSEKGRRLFDLALGPLALAFVGHSDKESITSIKALEATYGHGWVREWLAAKSLDLNTFGVEA